VGITLLGRSDVSLAATIARRLQLGTVGRWTSKLLGLCYTRWLCSDCGCFYE